MRRQSIILLYGKTVSRKVLWWIPCSKVTSEEKRIWELFFESAFENNWNCFKSANLVIMSNTRIMLRGIDSKVVSRTSFTAVPGGP